MKNEQWRARCVLVYAAAVAIAPASAQTFPSKPVRIVVGVPPGGTNDTAARTLAVPLSAALGQSVIVENRPGGSQVIATEYVTRAPADGHTLFLAGFTLLANSVMRPKLPYDTFKDLTGVACISSDTLAVSVHPSLPAKNLKELIALARAKPGELSYASAGQGFPAHFAAELLKSTAKIDLLHVPYQGGGPSAIAVVGGHNPILFSTIPTVINHAANGRLRIIAVTSATRSPLLPNAPTVAESGLPGFDFTSIFGSFVRSATPKEAVTRLSNELLAALGQENVRKTLMRDGSMPLPLGPVEFDKLLHVKLEQVRKIVKDADIKLN